ncbi:hypothetical protein M2360_001199 [Rhizobium sp. SG_E_25_P2]|uniref:hypothetical protein n=1 Tax=Rhizobium sp. SG_E_25_P2 TaxID=2879942 RepID=UPI00247697A3|nr:hypothetical protein [Rhizobium sp. SG_E_25_P2]MDH6265809.1 hypothetical protein [Rhizobium sp. SG_E_25_P2]
MADFIAVIRRAVDGLSENTPDMRVKVYDRARSAVVRQLENMKPRPPESMFQRQLDKLDAAIREVESDYAEALPPATEPIAEPTAQPEAESWSEPEREPEPATPAPEPAVADELQPEPAPAEIARQADNEAVFAEPSDQASPEPEAVFYAGDADQLDGGAADQASLEYGVRDEPAETKIDEHFDSAAADDHRDEQSPSAETGEQPESPEQTVYADAGEPYYDGSDHQIEAVREETGVDDDADWRRDDAGVEPAFTQNAPEPAPLVEAEPIEQDAEPFTWPHYQEPVRSEPEPVRAEWPETVLENLPTATAQTAAPAEAFSDPQDWAVEPASRQADTRRDPEMPRVVYDESDVVSGFNAFVQEEINRQVVPPPPGKRPPEEDLGWGASFDDLPELPKTDAFDEALKAKQDALASGADAQAQDKTPRAELAELVGFDEMAALTTPDPEWVQVPAAAGKKNKKTAGKGFKAGKTKDRGGKTGRKMVPLIAGLAGAVILGGAAYGVWTYRDDLSELIASASGPAETPATPQAEKAVTPSKAPDDSATAPSAAKPTEVASLDAGPQKFTQRLMPDGSETESDASKAIVDEALPEGKSVAGQTEKSKEVASTDPAAPTDAKPAAATGVGVTQKMFLYEERLGQSTPSATPGSVAWSEKTEDDGDKPVPSIQAKVEAPGRKMTALITFKKNMDPSLPASHIVEIVFDLPASFEEGNVESVQRIAFKQTEQDAGNPLIAVPAKVTDDYHMVALNSDAEAQKVNIDLMKNRGWIDIPITYRNGRRGLITLEKGASGTALFDKVIGEWSALGSQAAAP